jgi:hypothetical protein
MYGIKTQNDLDSPFSREGGGGRSQLNGQWKFLLLNGPWKVLLLGGP